jgi:hypothetical protein
VCPSDSTPYYIFGSVNPFPYERHGQGAYVYSPTPGCARTWPQSPTLLVLLWPADSVVSSASTRAHRCVPRLPSSPVDTSRTCCCSLRNRTTGVPLACCQQSPPLAIFSSIGSSRFLAAAVGSVVRGTSLQQRTRRNKQKAWRATRTCSCSLRQLSCRLMLHFIHDAESSRKTKFVNILDPLQVARIEVFWTHRISTPLRTASYV